MKKTMAIILSLALLLACFSTSSAAEKSTDEPKLDFEALQEGYATFDRSSATRLEPDYELVKEKSATRSGMDYIYPAETMYMQSAVKGKKMDMHFLLECNGNYGYMFEVQIFKGSEINYDKLVANWYADYPTAEGYYNKKIEWDTSNASTGTYLVICFTGDENYLYQDTVYGVEVTVVSTAKPLERICTVDVDTGKEITRIPMQMASETYVWLEPTPFDHTNSRDISVKSSNSDIAYGYEQGGVIFLEKYTMATATITITMGGKSCTLEAYTPIDGLSLDRSTASIDNGQETLLTATLTPEGVTANVTWKSSDPSVATVKNGLVKAVKPGTTVITASAQGYSAECAVTVNSINPATSISLPAQTYQLHQAATQQLNATLTPADSDSPISWASSDTGVVTVDKNGLVKAVGAGTATVTGTVYGSSLTATATFTVSPCVALHFTDMPKLSNWAHAGLDFAIENGLFNGTSDTTISPDVAMSRAMLVTVLWRAEGSPSGGKNPFSDVPAGKYYTGAVAWANENNIVNGVGDGKFNPDGNITREQMATILFRYAAYKGINTEARTDLSTFPDAGKVSGWAANAMQWAIAEGLITGSANNGVSYIEPQGNATRAQVATVLMRYMQKNTEE
jgi:hypothetical protein